MWWFLNSRLFPDWNNFMKGYERPLVMTHIHTYRQTKADRQNSKGHIYKTA